MNRFCFAFLLLFALKVFAAEPLPYSTAPNDIFWDEQWYLENLDADGNRLGIDLNARAAWSISKGQGIAIAIVDDGVELTHPDLTNKAIPALHWNFFTETNDGSHPEDRRIHGTPVAGLAVAESNNGQGISGIAPEARFASWMIYKTNSIGGPFVNTNQLAKMFRFHNDEVQVQNHSWTAGIGARLAPMSSVEDEAIRDATENGRQGRGVIIVRAAGNERLDGRNVNDDAYASDHRVITVAALRPDGIVAEYSNPGAAILVSAPGGQTDVGTLFTTDRLGRKGFNGISFSNNPALSDYVFSSLGFSGTSAAAPLISGIAALLLSANPSLTYRDVQQILLHAAYQTHAGDPDTRTNGAGFQVSHNTGFGLVNAGTAVDLARSWRKRSAMTSVKSTAQAFADIVDAGLLLGIIAPGGEIQNGTIRALPGAGPHVDETTPNVPLINVGLALEPLQIDLTNKAALIQRGGTNFMTKIRHAANAGAHFAVIYNDRDTNEVQFLGGTDFVTIPAISISRAEGEGLTNFLRQFPLNAFIHLRATQYEFQITEPLLCEHVKVTANFTHEQRGDMRVTLVSPMGTRSVLQRFGTDTNAFSGAWTFMTTHHFYESSQGTWELSFSDETQGGVGSVQSVTLEVFGVPIKDDDRDGLDDDWELTAFDSLDGGPLDDPDRDGYSNAREQVLGSDPDINESALALNLSLWKDSIVRLNWPSLEGAHYEVLTGSKIDEPLAPVAEVAGGFPRSAWFGKLTNRSQFFMVREKR